MDFDWLEVVFMEMNSIILYLKATPPLEQFVILRKNLEPFNFEMTNDE